MHTEFPKLRLMLVPRHKERFSEVTALIKRQGWPVLQRSHLALSAHATSLTVGLADRPVMLLDTLGELSACWGLADIAFVGGSLSRRGGQNMIEPAGYGAAVLFGPHTHNFKDVVAMLLDADAARVIPQPTDFTSTIRKLLLNPQDATDMGRRAQQLVTAQRGATQQTVELIVQTVAPQEQRKRAA